MRLAAVTRSNHMTARHLSALMTQSAIGSYRSNLGGNVMSVPPCCVSSTVERSVFDTNEI
jgi:hypothetical protein